MSACPQCGEDNPARARFCWACGAPLPAAPARGREVRKTVTVLFSDIKGSTGLGEQLDPESHRRVIGRFFAEMRGALERHGGTVEKFIGDAVMGVFGIPALHEDDALRAVRAAMEMHEALERLNEDFRRSFGLELAMRTGVNTGEVVAGEPGAGTLVTGDAVVVAKRLEETAAPGEIQLGPVTYRLVAECVEAEAVGPVALKGKSDPVSAWRLLAVTAGAELPQVRLGSPLVGRDLELAALEQTFDLAVADRSCHLFTVLGPAGIGKSRLTHEFVERVGSRATVLRGHCLSYGEGITFWPLVEVVTEAVGLTDEDDAEMVCAKIGAVLTADDEAPLVCERIAAAVGRGDAEVRAAETFWAVRKLFEALARERPLIVIFDDIQWAEETFLDLVEYLAGWSERPILILCMARLELLELRASWTAPRVHSASIALEPLIEPESDRLIQNLLGETGLEEGARRRIAAAAQGNPLFVEEMLRMLIDDGLLRQEGELWKAPDDLSGLEVPPTIHALLGARIDRLPAPERAVVQRASVVGQVFWWGAVAALSDGADAVSSGDLQALVRKELILPERSTLAGEDAYRISHILIRDAAYGALPKEVRAALHERLAGWLERRTGDYDELVGYHLEQAHRYRGELGMLDAATEELAGRAGRRLAAAGRRALSRADMPGAANLLERAATLLPPRAPERLELLPELGAALWALGNLARADDVLEEAIGLAEEAGDRRTELHARIERSTQLLYTDPEGRTAELVRIADTYIPIFEELGDELGLARARRLLAEVHWMRGRFAEMEEVLEEALVHAERAGARHESVAILGDIARVLFVGPTPAEAGIRRCDEILRHPSRDLYLEAVVAAMVSGLEAMRGEFARARRLYRRSKSVFGELGLKVPLARLPLYSGQVELLAGNPKAAERELRAGYEIFEEMGEKGRLSTIAAFLSRALYEQGRHDEAERYTEVSERSASDDDFVSQVVWRQTRAKLLAERGEMEAGTALAREAVALAAETDYLNMHGDALLDLAETLRLAEANKEARGAVEAALGLFERKGNSVSSARGAVLLAELARPRIA